MSRGRFLALLLGAVFCGCAETPEGTALPVTSVTNPAKGEAFRLTIADKRRFGVAFEKASVPSAAPAGEKNRVFGRNGAGAPPLLLAKDTSVTQVVHEALANALKESGYRVVSADDPAFAGATPLTADLDTFWAWKIAVSPEPVTIFYYECDIDLRLGGDWPLADYGERRLRGNEWMFEPEASATHWRAILTECLGEIDDVLKFALKKPGAS